MPQMREIVVTVESDGSTVVETSGFAGGECKKMTAALEGALGTVETDTLKREYHQAPQEVKQGQKAGA